MILFVEKFGHFPESLGLLIIREEFVYMRTHMGTLLFLVETHIGTLHFLTRVDKKCYIWSKAHIVFLFFFNIYIYIKLDNCIQLKVKINSFKKEVQIDYKYSI